MAIRRQSGLDRYGACEAYLSSRIRGLTIPPVAVGVKLNADNQVYGAVIDMPMGRDLLTTLVVLMNGTANLYFNTGGGVLGLGQKHQTVSSAVRSFLVSAGQALPSCTHTREYDLPTHKTNYVYLLTRRGVYKMELEPSTMLTETDKSKRFIFSMYQKILTELRVAQMRDRAEAQKNGGERVITLNPKNGKPITRPTNVTITRGSTASPLKIDGIEKVKPREE
ncbi:MAG: hypothetical protein LIO71_06460 [Ruminococcus sp.]|nr:hypothetical protein [Ruminococcus sp.]MCD7800332.1 hypothetical protein [Ruminococcus sp.]